MGIGCSAAGKICGEDGGAGEGETYGDLKGCLQVQCVGRTKMPKVCVLAAISARLRQASGEMLRAGREQ